MSFVAPFFFVGFTALLVPIIIHLWSQNTRKSVDFGSLQFLQESETKTMRSLMPSQWLLLMSRVFLLSILVLLLAEPQFPGTSNEVDSLYMIDTRYKNSDWLPNLGDTLTGSNKIVWLANGFEEISEPAPASPADYWKVLASPPHIPAKQMIVVSPLLLKDFSFERTEFPVRYQWLSPPVTPYNEQLITFRKNDQAYGVESLFDEWKTSHNRRAIENAESIRLTCFFKTDEPYRHYEQIFTAAVSTLNELSVFEVEQVESTEKADVIFWFSDDPPLAGTKQIAIEPAQTGLWNEVLPGTIRISGNWKKEDAIRLDLPVKLLDLFGYDLVDTDQWDQRTIDPASFTYKANSANEEWLYEQNNAGFLWIILLLGLMTERWIAFKDGRK